MEPCSTLAAVSVSTVDLVTHGLSTQDAYETPSESRGKG